MAELTFGIYDAQKAGQIFISVDTAVMKKEIDVNNSFDLFLADGYDGGNPVKKSTAPLLR